MKRETIIAKLEKDGHFEMFIFKQSILFIKLSDNGWYSGIEFRDNGICKTLMKSSPADLKTLLDSLYRLYDLENIEED